MSTDDRILLLEQQEIEPCELKATLVEKARQLAEVIVTLLIGAEHRP